MKVLMLQDDFPPQSFGGAGMSVYDLALGLQKAGHRVYVITTCQKKTDEANFEQQGLKIFRIYANHHERWRAYFSLYNPQTVGKVRKLMEEINPDIIHAHNIHAYLSYHCLKLAREYSRAVFLTARDVMFFNYGKLATKRYLDKFDARTSWLGHLKQARKRYNPFRNMVIRHYLKYADKIFTISRALKDALGANGIGNIEVSYTGIDVNDWQVNSELVEEFKRKYKLEGKKIIFFGGRISGLKGLEQINQAIDKVKKVISETILLMAGTEGVGWLEGCDLKAAYHSADVVAVPSVCFDAFPRSTFEAMACKKPVVGTCYGGTPEIIQDGITGYIVNPFNTELMAERIIDLLKNQEKAKRLGLAGFERVKKYFSRDYHVTQTISWYEKYGAASSAEAVFLDRDGIININKPEYLHKIDDFKFAPGALSALEKLSRTDYKIIIVTNQSGIGRGYFTENDLKLLHQRMLGEFKKENIRIDKIYYCPHAPWDNCQCRKPKIGMLKKAVKDFGINLSKSWIIGDSEKDISMGKAANLKTILIGKSVKNLEEAVNIIMK